MYMGFKRLITWILPSQLHFTKSQKITQALINTTVSSQGPASVYHTQSQESSGHWPPKSSIEREYLWELV